MISLGPVVLVGLLVTGLPNETGFEIQLGSCKAAPEVDAFLPVLKAGKFTCLVREGQEIEVGGVLAFVRTADGEKSVVRSPCDGFVVEVLKRQGEDASQFEPVMRVVSVKRIVVTCDVKMESAPALRGLRRKALIVGTATFRVAGKSETVEAEKVRLVGRSEESLIVQVFLPNAPTASGPKLSADAFERCSVRILDANK